MSKTVCIIGAGASGLTAIKSCLDEDLTPVCYERSHGIGGLWRYESDEKEGACVYKSIIINTSKEMMCYSDFPIPKKFPNYMHNTKVYEYFKLYCEKFNLMKYIHFNIEILSCRFAEDYDSTGRWSVLSRNRKTGEEKKEEFDAILVCIGHHAIPYTPLNSFPGIEKFKGETMHSHSYRQPHKFEDKRVLVIGFGNSGGDIAVELGKHASKLFVSTRRGGWILNRVGDNGMPTDCVFTTRLMMGFLLSFPSSVSNGFVEGQLNKRFDHAQYGIKPKHRFTSQHPMVNDSIPNAILSGMMVVKGNVREFTETEAIFEDGTREVIDVVIFATGYVFEFPFLEDDVIKVCNNDCRLYKHVWPPHLKHGSLAVIGGVQPLGAINPISEMQCRWATKVFKGEISLPSREVMDKDVDFKKVVMSKGYYKSQRHTIQVAYISYMDELAEQIGVKPNIIKWLLTDFKLGWKLITGPCTPYQYRLDGPGRWALARDTIMTQDERIAYPLTHGKVAVEEKGRFWMIVLLVLAIAVLFWQFV